MSDLARLRRVHHRAKRRTRDASHAVCKALDQHGPESDSPELDAACRELRQAQRAQQSAWDDVRNSIRKQKEQTT